MLLITDSQGIDPAKTTEATAVVINQLMYDSLLEIDADSKLQPGLAERWEISSDGLTYTFTLRPGVKFHNGRAMTAEDVKYTIDRIRDPATASVRLRNYAPVAETRAPSPTTFELVLKEPSAPMLANLAHASASIVAKETVEQHGDLKQTGVGTGPFKLVEWVRDTHVKLERNPDYWRPNQPYLDGVTITFNSDENARTAAVRSGSVDLLFQAPAALVDVIRRDPAVTLQGGEAGSWSYFDLNMTKAPFDDVRVRQAIYTAIDRQQVAEFARPGTSTMLHGGFISPTAWGGISTPVLAPDQAKAKALLAEAGHPNGFKMTLSTLAGWDFHIRTAQAIQQQLKPVGIDVEVKVLESGVLNSDNSKGNYDSVVLGFSGTIDPDERLGQTFVCNGGTNWSKYCDPEVDALVEQARKINDLNERERLYRQIQERLTQQGPKAFLFMWHNYDALRPEVKGYVWNPAPSYRQLRDVWLDR